MSAKITRFEFNGDSEFDLSPRYNRELVEARFNQLKDGLVSETLDDTNAVILHRRIEHAANEAAGLSWTTGFPLLVFPQLFDELARKERLKAIRQEQIRAKTQTLLEAV